MGLQRQLFTYFQEIDLHVNSRDELGSILGYSSIGSLLGFTTNTGSAEEKKFEQVKAVYAGLEAVLDNLKSPGEGASLLNSDSGFAILCGLKMDIDPKVREYLSASPPDEESGEFNFGSGLVGLFLAQLSRRRGNYEDHLRRGGLRLMESVYESGPLHGSRRRILLGDYGKIKMVLG